MDAIPEKDAVKVSKPASGAEESVNKLADQLAEVPLKQKRFLSDDTHAYEHFELPISRVSILSNCSVISEVYVIEC